MSSFCRCIQVLTESSSVTYRSHSRIKVSSRWRGQTRYWQSYIVFLARYYSFPSSRYEYPNRKLPPKKKINLNNPKLSAVKKTGFVFVARDKLRNCSELFYVVLDRS